MIARFIAEIVGISPWALPLVIATIVISPWLAPAAARTLGLNRGTALLMLLSLGGIASLTLTPYAGFAEHPGSCDLSLAGIPDVAVLTTISDRSLNVLLFIPLGVALALVPRGRRLPAILVALCIPAAIELTQETVLMLNRACQLQDVVDNESGLVIGVVGGVLLGAFAGGLLSIWHRERVGGRQGEP